MTHSILRLQAGCVGCFSADHLGIELSSEDGRYFIRMQRALDRPCSAEHAFPREITSAEATILLNSVRRTVEEPESGGQGRSTTRYYAELDVLIGNMTAPFKCESSAMPCEALQDVSNDLQVNTGTREKAKQLLEGGYHVWAHELYFLTHSLFEKHY